jgi:acyl-CoA synthetase (AMP-forming)/AMP-acid ligase II
MDLIAQHAAAQPDRAALVGPDRTMSWRELRDLRNRLADALVRRGLLPGEHAVIYSLNEIEDALHRHPKIQDAAVFGVPDEEWGERVHAALQLRPGERLPVEDVIDFCRQHLAGYKIPREVSFHEVFPRDAAGKLIKRVLRDPYWAHRASRV